MVSSIAASRLYIAIAHCRRGKSASLPWINIALDQYCFVSILPWINILPRAANAHAMRRLPCRDTTQRAASNKGTTVRAVNNVERRRESAPSLSHSSMTNSLTLTQVTSVDLMQPQSKVFFSGARR